MSNLPLMILPLVAYNLLVFVLGGVEWQATAAAVPMMSDAVWTMTWSDVFVFATLLVLFVEILKATRAHFGSLVDHMLSTLVFVACVVEFLLVERAATSTFFLLTAIAFVGVVAGYSTATRSARRDFAAGSHGDI